MEYVAGTELGKGFLDAAAVAHIAHEQLDIGIGIVFLHVQRDVVHGRLGLVKEHNLAGAVVGYLTDNLAADGAARAGDEYTRAVDVLLDERVVQHDGVSAQQVLDLHLLDEG